MNADQLPQLVIIYVLGGGTFEVSLIKLTPDKVVVIGTLGSTHLGGRSWDECLIEYLLLQYRQQWGVGLAGSTRQELMIQAEQIKQALSTNQSTQARIGGVQSAIYTVTREVFENLTRDLVAQTQQLTERLMAECGFTWDQIDGVIPVGSSTRMPMIRACIERMSGKPPIGGVNPDEAVALGAAIQAACYIEQLAGGERFRLPGRKAIQDVSAHSTPFVKRG